MACESDEERTQRRLSRVSRMVNVVVASSQPLLYYSVQIETRRAHNYINVGIKDANSADSYTEAQAIKAFLHTSEISLLKD